MNKAIRLKCLFVLILILKCLFVLIFLLLVAGAVIQETRLSSLFEYVPASEPLASEFGVPGIASPHLFAGDQSGVADHAAIIGVVQSGEARAYLVSAFFFHGSPGSHIVNDVFGSIPITVTHCDRTECTCVFTSDQVSGKPLDVRAGGLTPDNQMALLIDGQRYTQESAKIPLQEVEFVQTTWKEWRQEHPQSTIYLGYAPPGG
jgi:Protein of unknown function (DUF3179)